jgi:hypothetical protein
VKAANKLQGVQHKLAARFPKLAYRVRLGKGTLVLCDVHLDALRKTQRAPLTGETFEAKLCDHCHPERT